MNFAHGSLCGCDTVTAVANRDITVTFTVTDIVTVTDTITVTNITTVIDIITVANRDATVTNIATTPA